MQDGGDPWRLDPANDYRTFVDGIENSGLRVRDCSRPLLDATSVTTSATGIEASVAIQAVEEIASVRAELRHDFEITAVDASALSLEGNRLNVSIDGLETGKHTLAVFATGESGSESESLLLPFWVEEEAFSWEDAIIYMTMTDRFRNGEPSNDVSMPSAPGAGFEGGDLQGLTQALNEGYFDDLGVNAMWLTPFNENPEGTYLDSGGTWEVAGYHGYWPTSARTVDMRIGGGEALKEFILAAHARGIRILMDLVVNHVHEDHPYVTRHPSWFNEGCVCGEGDCGWTTRRLDCLFRPYMPDVNWRVREAGEQFVEDALFWLEEYDLDGFRIDAVKHVEDAAILNVGVRVRERFETAGTQYFLMGETAMGWDPSSGPSAGGNIENYDTISRYIGENALNGQFDFPLYYAASLQFLNDEPGRGMSHIEFWTRASLERYPAESIMTPYIGSHDVPRFMTLSANPDLAGNQWENTPPPPGSQEPYDRMYVAFAWLMSIPGAPLVYYGDEYGEYGSADPDNRHRMRFDSELTETERAQRERVSALFRGRRAIPGFRSRAIETVFANESVWAAVRGEGDERAVVVLNAGPNPENVSIELPRELRGAYNDFLSGERIEMNGGNINLPARSALYLTRAE